ncbi:5'-nucleotidase C-terminal domain-containing protein, partial [Comamonas sp.]
GRRVSELRLNGRRLEMSQHYRVGLQSYLGGGGDNFSIFAQGIDVVGGMLDLDALAEHVREQSRSGPMALPLKERITRVH